MSNNGFFKRKKSSLEAEEKPVFRSCHFPNYFLKKLLFFFPLLEPNFPPWALSYLGSDRGE